MDTTLGFLRQLLRVVAIAATTGLVAVGTVGCDEAAPISGKVIDKKYEAADINNVAICEWSEDNPCKKMSFDQLPKSAHFKLLIEDGDQTKWVEVPPEVFSRVYVGDPWPERRPTASATGTTPTTTAAAPTDPGPGTPYPSP